MGSCSLGSGPAEWQPSVTAWLPVVSGTVLSMERHDLYRPEVQHTFRLDSLHNTVTTAHVFMVQLSQVVSWSSCSSSGPTQCGTIEASRCQSNCESVLGGTWACTNSGGRTLTYACTAKW
jgi:hypothetical protein